MMSNLGVADDSVDAVNDGFGVTIESIEKRPGKRKFPVESDNTLGIQSLEHSTNELPSFKRRISKSNEQNIVNLSLNSLEHPQLPRLIKSPRCLTSSSLNVNEEMANSSSFFSTLTQSATNSNLKYNVLQVLQPTSAYSACNLAVTEHPSPSSTSPVTTPDQVINSSSVQQHQAALDFRNISNETQPRSQDSGELGKHTTSAPEPIIARPAAEVSALMPSLAALATYPMFNWCAKCNASFRMTSDLVQHMRTYHKRRKTAVSSEST